MNFVLNEIDFKILNYLAEFPEKSFKQMALELNTTTPTIYNRIDKMKKEGIIKGIHQEFNLFKLGYTVSALIEINAEENKAQEIAKKISNYSGVVSIKLAIGRYDLHVFTEMHSTRELQDLVNDILKIPGTIGILAQIYTTTIFEKPFPFPIKKPQKS